LTAMKLESDAGSVQSNATSVYAVCNCVFVADIHKTTTEFHRQLLTL